MFEKNLEINYLLDFYGDVLNERKRSILEMYYNDDFSLSEIADDIGISRQGVRDIIKKAEDELIFLEEKLGLYKKFREFGSKAESVLKSIENADIPEEIKKEITDFAESVANAI